jgi:hypothetical protein
VVGVGVGVVVGVGVGAGVGVGVTGGVMVKLADGPCGAPVVDAVKLPSAGVAAVPPAGMPFQVAVWLFDCPG